MAGSICLLEIFGTAIAVILITVRCDKPAASGQSLASIPEQRSRQLSREDIPKHVPLRKSTNLAAKSRSERDSDESVIAWSRSLRAANPSPKQQGDDARLNEPVSLLQPGDQIHPGHAGTQLNAVCDTRFARRPESTQPNRNPNHRSSTPDQHTAPW